MMTTTISGVTRQLASSLADLRFEDLPKEVVARTEELFLDWISSALAGRNARPVEALERFAQTMGPDGGPSEILVSRRRSSPPLDGVTAALDDPDRLAADVDRARRLGFGGKLCIHPKQIEAVNRGFVPSQTEISWARRVLEAAEATGAVRFEGEIVDRPVIERARGILARTSG